MTVSYGFYDSLAGDRTYNADQMSRLFEGIITSGVFQGVGDALMVSATTGMTVSVGTGRAWFQNTWTLNDSALSLVHDPSTVGLNRIDTIILEVNKDLGVRANSIKIKKGVEGTSPSAPTLTHTATLNQYPLADVYIGSGVSSINQGNITNRVGLTDTPFITGVLESLDATALTAQWDAQFDAWFTNLQNQLDSNQAANLQNQINTLTTNLSTETTNRTNGDTTLQNELNDGWVPAGETWTYSTFGGPVDSFTVSGDKTAKYYPGMRIKLTQTTVKYFIVVKVAYSSPNTTVSIYGGTDYSLAAATITSPYYSMMKVPAGFNARQSKWTYNSVANTASVSQTSPVANTWYNLGSLTAIMPVGLWRLTYSVAGVVEGNASATSVGFRVTIGTINGGESDANNTLAFLNTGYAAGSSPAVRMPLSKTIDVEITTQTTWYLNAMTDTNNAGAIRFRGDFATTSVKLLCGYL